MQTDIDYPPPKICQSVHERDRNACMSVSESLINSILRVQARVEVNVYNFFRTRGFVFFFWADEQP